MSYEYHGLWVGALDNCGESQGSLIYTVNCNRPWVLDQIHNT